MHVCCFTFLDLSKLNVFHLCRLQNNYAVFNRSLLRKCKNLLIKWKLSVIHEVMCNDIHKYYKFISFSHKTKPFMYTIFSFNENMVINQQFYFAEDSSSYLSCVIACHKEVIKVNCSLIMYINDCHAQCCIVRLR